MPDFRSDPSDSIEGAGKARAAWEAYRRGVEKVISPAVTPVRGVLARKWTEDMVGFWVMWHLLGGFEGLEESGMHKTTIWRKVKKFRTLFGEHPDAYLFPGITIDRESAWKQLLAETDEG
jgi:hypothetical protein